MSRLGPLRLRSPRISRRSLAHYGRPDTSTVLAIYLSWSAQRSSRSRSSSVVCCRSEAGVGVEPRLGMKRVGSECVWPVRALKLDLMGVGSQFEGVR
ncbi:hypothetical protein BU16DRAFT_563542 [Lophium mytilinum]|uniref:Uncharacterized protein n=1 Tax=Lophium mytilinum TaxID=390894 RepID=A0A6A6QLL8_9PEZI|nr:hypothetical protein BU16DRAFT_563542 [Lophium mytilinum]